LVFGYFGLVLTIIELFSKGEAKNRYVGFEANLSNTSLKKQ
jgi:hypothetical protein